MGLTDCAFHRLSPVSRESSRVYANDTIVVVNAYANQTWVDRTGNSTTAATRATVVWVKIGGKWLTVDHHVSKVPGTQ